ncbi:MAG: hypothetical protein D3924_16875, partial [Candidatus Electrothrix sp. AR4]|nr:hypothetical protein [Candidatus Electrothrix sp. AR4]
LAHYLCLGWSRPFNEKGEIALMAQQTVWTGNIRRHAALLMQGQPEDTATERIGKGGQRELFKCLEGKSIFGDDEFRCIIVHDGCLR